MHIYPAPNSNNIFTTWIRNQFSGLCFPNPDIFTKFIYCHQFLFIVHSRSPFLIFYYTILQAAVRKQRHWNFTIFSDRSSLPPEVSLSETASSPQSPYPSACNQISIARTFTSMFGSTFHRFQYLKLCDTVSQSTDTDSHGVFIKWLHCSIRPAGLQYELVKVQKYSQFFMPGHPYMELG